MDRDSTIPEFETANDENNMSNTSAQNIPVQPTTQTTSILSRTNVDRLARNPTGANPAAASGLPPSIAADSLMPSEASETARPTKRPAQEEADPEPTFAAPFLPRRYTLKDWQNKFGGQQVDANSLRKYHNFIVESYANHPDVLVQRIKQSDKNMFEAIITSAKSLAPKNLQGIQESTLSLIANYFMRSYRSASNVDLHNQYLNFVAHNLGVYILLYNASKNEAAPAPFLQFGSPTKPLFAALARTTRSSQRGIISHYDAFVFNNHPPK